MSIVKVFSQSGLTQGVQFFEDPTGQWDFSISAQDLADCLGISEARKIPCKKKYQSVVQKLDSDGFPSNALVILEPGIYEAISRSQASHVEAFQKWLWEDVIPSIRRTGRYEDSSVLSQLNEVKKRLALAKAENERLADVKEAIESFHVDLSQVVRVRGRFYVPLQIYDPNNKQMIGTLSAEAIANLTCISFPGIHETSGVQ